MSRIVHGLIALLLALAPGSAFADPVTITRATAVISDTMNNLNPRLFTDTVMDYKLTVSNPLGNALVPVRNIVIVENMPTNCDLQVTDIATAGKGPVEFLDGSLLGTGLLSSGLTYTYNPAAVDSIEFSTDGVTFVSTAAATSGNYNPSIRAIRITLAGTFVTSTAFQLRYRVKIK
jgi:hypothetical protein